MSIKSKERILKKRSSFLFPELRQISQTSILVYIWVEEINKLNRK